MFVQHEITILPRSVQRVMISQLVGPTDTCDMRYRAAHRSEKAQFPHKLTVDGANQDLWLILPAHRS